LQVFVSFFDEVLDWDVVAVLLMKSKHGKGRRGDKGRTISEVHKTHKRPVICYAHQ